MELILAGSECNHHYKWLGHVNRDGFFLKPYMRHPQGLFSTDAAAGHAEALRVDGVVPPLPFDVHVFKSDESVKLLDKDGSDRCVNPVLYRCQVGCGSEYLGTCNSRDAEVCAPCEKRYRTRVRGIARIPMTVARKGSVLLVTLTAPGERRHCLTHTYVDKQGKVQPSYRCDWDAFDLGMIPADGRSCVECVCSEHRITTNEGMRDFNSSIGRKFNDFITDLRRTFPEFEKVQYFRANEPQERGLLHIHILFIMKRVSKIDTELSRALTDVAMRIGFGHQLDIKRIGNGELDQVTAARYVAKYVSKTDSFKRLPFHQTEYFAKYDADNMRMKKAFVFRRPRTWSCSRGWGLSMSSITAQQALHASGRSDLAVEFIDRKLDVLRAFQDDPGELTGLLLA